MSGRTYGILLVTVATVLWSTAGLFVRMLDLDVWTILAWRSLFGCLSLGVVVLFQDGWRLKGFGASFGWPGACGVMASALSMVGYIGALKLTTVANVLAIYATLPFVASGLALLWMGERIERRVLLASAIALVGVLVVVGFAARPQDLFGSALAFLMTVMFSVLLILSRRYRRLGMAHVNALGSASCVLLCLPLMSHTLPAPFQLGVLALFGFTSTALAYLLFLKGGRYIASGEAGLIALLDVVLGPLWVWLAYSETPGPATIAGSAVVLGAVAWYMGSGLRRPAAALEA